jgi:hypothetical protein
MAVKALLGKSGAFDAAMRALVLAGFPGEAKKSEEK